MATSYSKPTLSRWAGRAAARTWRWLVQRDMQFVARMISSGISPNAAKLAGICAKLVVFGCVFYLAVWAFLLATVAVGVVWLVGTSQKKTFLSKVDDHRKNVFYDPVNYDDDPDPRFDERM
ncbi:DUF3742 family protein [Paracidovorax valerianellae]|nr:DUF3742 family protein [Paracidovorax valerianellae]MDA8446508.1 DUF3742 family protein [Paracidovorax valerianellae]